MTFIEVGGHGGITTGFVMQHPNLNVIVFEPNVPFYNKLAEKYDGQDSIRIENAALWNKTEMQEFYVGNTAASGASSLHKDKTGLEDASVHMVLCWAATEYIEKVRAVDPDIMVNLNCEGAELEIMDDLMNSGAWKGLKIFVKSHKAKMPEPERYDKMVARMNALGVDYFPGEYVSIYKGAIRKEISVRQVLDRHGKGDWDVWFPSIEDTNK